MTYMYLTRPKARKSSIVRLYQSACVALFWFRLVNYILCTRPGARQILARAPVYTSPGYGLGRRLDKPLKLCF